MDMDMDIDDILASVDYDPSTPESTALDHQLLTRAWVAERAVSELLPWPGPLMDRMMERVRRQIERIEDLASSNTTNANLTLSILQTDLARTQYLLRSLLRQRLSKLTRYSLHYQQTTTPLSASESAFLHSHHSLLTDLYAASFMDSFPPALRRLDDNAGGTSMVQGPETREAVVVRCLGEEVRVVVPPGDGVEEVQLGTTMRMGDVWVVRWEGVRGAWERGDVEVL